MRAKNIQGIIKGKNTKEIRLTFATFSNTLQITIMSELTITTNNHYREILNAFELTKKHQKEMRATDEEMRKYEEDGIQFVVYQGYPHRLDDFMRIDFYSNNSPFPSFWHGHASDSFFSGLLIHISDDGDGVIVGRYCS